MYYILLSFIYTSAGEIKYKFMFIDDIMYEESGKTLYLYFFPPKITCKLYYLYYTQFMHVFVLIYIFISK